jgi:hypothetical protein
VKKVKGNRCLPRALGCLEKDQASACEPARQDDLIPRYPLGAITGIQTRCSTGMQNVFQREEFNRCTFAARPVEHHMQVRGKHDSVGACLLPGCGG